jgi:hypothetical protein
MLPATSALPVTSAPVLVLRPEYQRLLGSRTAALLLNQIQFLFLNVSKRKPFYKFKLPCASPAYKTGDSWCETLGFSRAEFDAALSKIGTKICRGVSRKLLEQTRVPVRAADESDDAYAARFQTALKCLVLYWTDDQRRTWYQLNERLLDAFLHLLYLDKATSPRCSAKVREGRSSSKVEKSLYIETSAADVTSLSENDSFSSERITEDPSESEDSEISSRLDQAEPVQCVTNQPAVTPAPLSVMPAPAPVNHPLYTLYAEQIGRPDAGVCKQLDALVRQYGIGCVEKAIVQAGQYGAKHVSYVTKVLQNRQQPHRRPTPAPAPQTALQKRWWEMEPPVIVQLPPAAPAVPLETFPEHVQKAWTLALAQLKAQLNAGSFKEALPPMQLIAYHADTPSRWVVQLPTAHQRDQCAYRFTRQLTRMLSPLAEEEVKMEFVAVY